MALTIEIIQRNPQLAGLTPEQMSAVCALSQNDEIAVIGARFSEVYRQMDETIEGALGVKRNGDEKTYRYLERAAKEFAGKYSDYKGLKEKVSQLEKDKAELQDKIDKGVSDQETAKALNQAKADLQAAKDQYASLKADFDKKKQDWEKSLFEVKVEGELNAAASQIKVRPDVNQQVAELAIKSAKSKVAGMSPKFEDDGKGGSVLMFHNSDGTRMNNVDNNLAPFTAAELLAKELAPYGIIDTGGGRNGTGGKTPPGSSALSSGASTRVQAVEAIGKGLAAQGLVKGTRPWQEAFDKAYDEGKVAELPEK